MSSATAEAVHCDSLDGLRKDTVNRRLATLSLNTFPRTMNPNKYWRPLDADQLPVRACLDTATFGLLTQGTRAPSHTPRVALFLSPAPRPLRLGYVCAAWRESHAAGAPKKLGANRLCCALHPKSCSGVQHKGLRTSCIPYIT